MNEEIRSLLERAVNQTPTLNNSQPFSTRWEGSTLVIHHDEERARHRLNYKNYSSLLSLGCLIENIRIVAIDNSLEFEEELNPADPLESAKLHFSPTISKEFMGLSKFISLRCTDSRVYHDGWSDKDEVILNGISRDYSATLKMYQTLSEKVFDTILELESVIWKDSEAFFDTTKWLRFTKAELQTSSDGVPVRRLHSNAVVSKLTWLASKSPYLHRLIKNLGVMNLEKNLRREQLESSAGFIFFYPKDHTPRGIVEVGKLAQRIWLELTRLGHGVQPLTIGTLLPYLANHTPMVQYLPEKIGALYQTASLVMERELQFPVWGFRYGRVATDLPLTLRTQRLKVG